MGSQWGVVAGLRPVADWDEDEWGALMAWLMPWAMVRARALGLPAESGEDAAQTTAAALLECVRRGVVVHSPGMWVRCTLRRRLTDLARTEAARRRAIPQDAANPANLETIAERRDGPEAELLARDYLAWLGGVIDAWPPPFRQIAYAICLGWSRGEVVAYLQEWRPVSARTCDAMIAKTYRGLRAVEVGRNPRDLWREEENRKSGWKCSSTPPPLIRLSL